MTTAVLDTNTLLHLALAVVDDSNRAPSGEDPLRTVVGAYDVWVPSRVETELYEVMYGDDDKLADAAALTLDAVETGRIGTRPAGDPPKKLLDHGMDEGEVHAVAVANDLKPELFITDEFNTANYLLIGITLWNRNTLFTTPHVLCRLAQQGFLDSNYVHSALTYYERTKGWDRQYVEFLRTWYLED